MNSFKIFVLIVLVGFGLGACQDFLSNSPDNQYTKDRFYKDPVWSLGLLVNAYSNGSYPRNFTFEEVATDDAVSNNPTDLYLRLATGEWSSTFNTNVGWPTNTWSNAYTTITNMNLFLTIVNDVTWSWMDTTRNRLFRTRYTGEAYGFRGYYYMRLLQQYGGKGSDGSMLGVPITNDVASTSDNWKVQRATFQQTVDQIYADYAKGVALMPYRYFNRAGTTKPDIAWNQVNGYTQNLNLLNGERITGLKARLAILAASPAFNDGTNYNLVQADSAAKIVARMVTWNGGLNATVGPDPIFWDADDDITNADILWRNDYATSNSLESANFPPSLYGNGRINPTQNLVDAYPMANGYPITDPLSLYDPANPYAGRDPRLNLHILYNGGKERVTGSVGSNNVINTQADNAVNNDGLNKLALYSTRTGYYLKKLLRVATNMNPSSTTSLRHIYPVMRWTEMLLIYAEAENEIAGPDGDAGIGTVRSVIGAIRKRGAGAAGGGITQPDAYLASITSKAQMRDLIRNERRIELSFEGFRFWDLRRWNVPLAKLKEPAKGVSITGTTPKVYDYNAPGVNPVEDRAYSSFMYYGPIPYMETKKYPGFIQNAGW